MNELCGLFFWRFLLLFGAMMYLISPRRSDAAGFFRGHDAQGRGPSEWALMMSVFISGIFTKSVTNAANRGAGVFGRHSRPPVQRGVEQYAILLGTKLYGLALCSAAFVPPLLRSGRRLRSCEPPG